ncbi:hypothetical protein LINGRAHAP2_LOCUS31482 [Linum grandiflorum]
MFHEECTVTVHDVANLAGLVVTGDALYVEYEKEMDWAALVEEVLGKPPSRYLKNDGRLTMGWLHDSFYSCTDLADEDETQLIHIMWHRPDRVLRQFGMEQPIPHTEMLEGKVMALLGITWRQEVGMRETMQKYLAPWEMRDDHVVETGLVGNPER